MIYSILEDIRNRYVVRPVIVNIAVEFRNFLSLSVRSLPVSTLCNSYSPFNVLTTSLGILINCDPLALFLGIDHPLVFHWLTLAS